MTVAPRPQWYVVQSHSHAEARAAEHLARQGYETYLPRYLKRRSHARRVDTVMAPLFPRYLFVAIDQTAQRWRAIKSTIGVADLVRYGDAPAAVQEPVIAELRAREDEHGFIRLQQRPLLASGDRIVVVEGAFSTCFGLFDGMADKDRVAILLELLGRKVRVVLNSESIAAA